MKLVTESALKVLEEVGFEEQDITNFVKDYYANKVMSDDRKVSNTIDGVFDALAQSHSQLDAITRGIYEN